MKDYVEQGEVKQLIVQRTDGSTWTAEVGLDGRVRLLEQLSDPTKEVVKDKPEAATAEPEEPKESEEEGEAGEESKPTKPDWGEAKKDSKPEPGKVDDFLKQLDHRDIKDREDAHSLPPGYHERMPKNLLRDQKDTAFKARLASVMLDNKYDRRVKGRTRGKLDMTRLFKVPTGSRNVFMQKESRKGKQYNVVILIDESGSMRGKKATLAAESAVMLTKQLTDIGINVGVIGFESGVHVHKDLLEKPDYPFIYAKVANARGGNADYDAMRRAYAMLQRAPEGRKIMIMLSDGSPTGYSPASTYDSNGNKETILKPMPGGVDYDTKEHFHHLAKSNKDVLSYGIGIQHGGWQIPDHKVIQNVNDLKKTIIAGLRKGITRG